MWDSSQFGKFFKISRGCEILIRAIVLPPGVSARVAGSRLLATIGTLTGGYRLSKRLVQSLLQDMFAIEMSTGVISESEAVLAAALAPAVQQAQEHVRQAPVVFADETGHREQGMAGWLWVAIAGLVSVFLARASRSAEVARELLGAAIAGVLVSDRYAAYGWVAAQQRQVCRAHLLRDFTKISERSGEAGRLEKNCWRIPIACSRSGIGCATAP